MTLHPLPQVLYLPLLFPLALEDAGQDEVQTVVGYQGLRLLHVKILHLLQQHGAVEVWGALSVGEAFVEVDL